MNNTSTKKIPTTKMIAAICLFVYAALRISNMIGYWNFFGIAYSAAFIAAGVGLLIGMDLIVAIGYGGATLCMIWWLIQDLGFDYWEDK